MTVLLFASHGNDPLTRNLLVPSSHPGAWLYATGPWHGLPVVSHEYGWPAVPRFVKPAEPWPPGGRA